MVHFLFNTDNHKKIIDNIQKKISMFLNYLILKLELIC